MATSKQRREAERRRLKRQAERRARRRQARRRNNLILSVLGVAVVAAVVVGLIIATNGDDSAPAAAKSPGTSAPPTSPVASSASSSAARTATYPCTWTKSGAATRKASRPGTTKPPKTGKVGLTVKTTQGAMSFALDRSLAPCTVASFVSLVKQGYYDKSPCHRLTTSGIYVLQCGSPDGSPNGAPGYTIPDEATGQESYPAGTIAMARSQDKHSGGSQFFIVYKDSPSLKQGLGQLQYTVFGTVASGLSVVTKVADAGAASGSDGKPKLPITLTKVSVAK